MIPAPITPPMMECAVETGAPTHVARFNHSAAAKSAAIIAQTKVSGSATASGDTISPEMVDTTSPPAISAPAAIPPASAISGASPRLSAARRPAPATLSRASA